MRERGPTGIQTQRLKQLRRVKGQPSGPMPRSARLAESELHTLRLLPDVSRTPHIILRELTTCLAPWVQHIDHSRVQALEREMDLWCQGVPGTTT